MGRGAGQAGDSSTGTVSSRTDTVSLPDRLIKRICHIGSLDPDEKGKAMSASYEGHGLSVSRDPELWEAIARLGGAKWWSLENKAGGRFIEAHALTDAQRNAIEEWGIGQGYVNRVTAYRAYYFDEDYDEERYTVHEDRDDAELELEFQREDFPNREVKPVEEVQILKPTAKLQEKLGMESWDECFDHLLVIYGEDATDYDGVWWEDEYAELSAPRGVIFPSRLQDWQPNQVERGSWEPEFYS